MFPDRWGSDFDHHNWLNEFSPDISRDDWCEHNQRGTTCGKCQIIVTSDGPPESDTELTGAEMVAAVQAAMAKVTARLK